MNRTIQDIASEIGSGITPLRSNSKFWDSRDIPWVKTEQLGEYQIFDANEYISKTALEETAIKKWPPKTISVAMYGEGKTRGNASILMMQSTTNQACCNIIVDPEKADYRFLYYWLKNNYEQLRTLAAGVRKNLNSDDIKGFPFPNTAITSQTKIADVLSAIDDLIQHNTRICSELETMAKTLYDYWFTQFDFPDENGKPYRSSGGEMVWNDQLKREIPKGWDFRPLSHVISSVNTGLNPRDNFVLGNGDIQYLTVKNLTTSGTIDFSSCDTVDEQAREIIHKRSDVSVGDILFASIAPLGRCYLIQNSPEKWDINESVFSIRRNASRVTSEFLYMYFMSDTFIKAATSSSTGSIFKGIRVNTLLDIAAVIPPKDIVTAFTTQVKTLLALKEQKDTENRELTKLRDWLLPTLMNGQATVE